MERKQIDFSGLDLTDWARLAAYLDSEGHIRVVTKFQVTKGRRYLLDYLSIDVANTDPRLAEWLRARFGGHVAVSRQNDSRWRSCHHWRIGSAQAADVLRGALPYFVLKREQAEIALAFHATQRRRGVKGTPQSVKDEREVLKSKLRVLTARGPKATEVATG